MALKGNWIDKINGVDENSAEDINQVAHAVIDLENSASKVTAVDDTLTVAGAAADAKAVGDALGKKIGVEQLKNAVDNALSEAKESGEFDGEKGDPGKSAYQSAKEAGYTGTESAFASDLAKVGGKADAAHTQSASTITAGTFAGQVAANVSGQAPGVSCLRNSKIVSADTNPTVNGEINWTYK